MTETQLATSLYDARALIDALILASHSPSIDLSAYAGRTPVEMTGGTALPPITTAPYFLTLGPYGFYWLRLEEAGR